MTSAKKPIFFQEEKILKGILFSDLSDIKEKRQFRLTFQKKLYFSSNKIENLLKYCSL